MTIIKETGSKFDLYNINGMRVVVIAFGLLCGLTGVLTGIFEIPRGTVPLVTITSDILLTGILAIVISCSVIIWVLGFIHRKYGAIIFLGLSILQLLFVGGEPVIDLATLTCILATRINKPLNWWRLNLPENLRFWFAKLFPFSLLCYVIISSSMLILSILSINNEALSDLNIILAAAFFIPIVLMIFGGLAHDIQKQINTLLVDLALLD